MVLIMAINRKTLKEPQGVKLVGFLNDDVNLQGKRINGVKILDPLNFRDQLKGILFMKFY